MRFPEDQRAAAASLSAGYARLLDRVEAEPSLLARERYAAMVEAARRRISVFLGFDPKADYGLQPWPLILSAERKDAGLFVRLMPEAKGPVVNMVTGATVGMGFVAGDD